MAMRCPRKDCRSTNIVVVDRECNYSKFNGSRYTPSAYSGLRCLACRWPWRSKANGVRRVRDVTAEDRTALGWRS